MNYQLHQGDSAQVLKQYPDNHFDSIVTDPPYGISFLGKDWDSFRNSKVTKNSTVKNLGSGMRMTTTEENLNFQLWCEDWAKECYRVLKPGGHMLSFCAARMYHRMAVGLEDAGFQIRDQIMWIYGSGFPKSQDVGKNNDMPEWNGWGTALKPAHEPIALARKPMTQTIAKNCREWGVGAINVDACRVEYNGTHPRDLYGESYMNSGHGKSTNELQNMMGNERNGVYVNELGRFPSNVIGEIDEPYQKYFYCPKVSRKERHLGHDTPEPMFGDVQGCYGPDGKRMAEGLDNRGGGNNHPTVKPIELMKYLIKLVTPPNGRVLDPFNGSGSTGCAAVSLGHHYTGIDLDQHYLDISHKRIQAYNTSTYNDFFEEEV